MGRLGGITESAGEYSSAAKGETLEDTIRTVEGYSDIIVLRHFDKGAPRRRRHQVAGDQRRRRPRRAPDAGASGHIHHLQGLGRCDNIKVGLVGDLANGRTVRSLASMLTNPADVDRASSRPIADGGRHQRGVGREGFGGANRTT